MDRKPSFIREEHRDGIYALVIGRVAIPMWFFILVMVVIAVGSIVGISFGITTGTTAYAIPGIVIVGIALLLGLYKAFEFLIMDFIRVNRKDLDD
ncbi:membrane protein [Microbacterium phage Big4]|nr:membrane protein [Microbacterium phage Big4]